MSVVTMKELLEAGVHFGHRTRRWNPKMRPFIFTERSKIHIIDLQQTMLRINTYYEMVQDLVAQGGTVLFVGTKRQAQATIEEEASRCRMPYVNQRWLGGTLTNWTTIKQRIDYLLRLERRIDAGEFRNLSKKEQLAIAREAAKLNRRLGGLKIMKELPDLVFIVDTHLEELAVKEANKLHIPILGMVDTNANPDVVDFVIPSNDDAIRAVKLIVSLIADAAEEGMRIREVEMVDTGQVTEAELAEMEQYLGPSTLAKLQVSEEEEYSEDGYEGPDAVEEETVTIAEQAADAEAVGDSDAVAEEATEAASIVAESAEGDDGETVNVAEETVAETEEENTDMRGEEVIETGAETETVVAEVSADDNETAVAAEVTVSETEETEKDEEAR